MHHELSSSLSLRVFFCLGSIFSFALSAPESGIDIKEVGRLLDVASKDEGILLISLEVVINGIKKTVNEEIYDAEKVSEAAGKCASEVGEQTIKIVEGIMGSYVRDMFDKTEVYTDVLKNHTATQEELKAAQRKIQAEEAEILLDLAILRDEVLLPEAKRMSRKMAECRSLQ